MNEPFKGKHLECHKRFGYVLVLVNPKLLDTHQEIVEFKGTCFVCKTFGWKEMKKNIDMAMQIFRCPCLCHFIGGET